MFEGDMFAGQKPLFRKTAIIRGASSAITFSTMARSLISIHGLKSFLGSQERKFDGEAEQGHFTGVRGGVFPTIYTSSQNALRKALGRSSPQ
jgi:hypothetical protein